MRIHPDKPDICFAIISPCHAVVTDSQEWHQNRQLNAEMLDHIDLPASFRRVVACGYSFTCSEDEARSMLIDLGFKESPTLSESHILDNELIFGTG